MIKYGNRLNARPVGHERYQLPDGNVVSAQCLADMECNIDRAELMHEHGISSTEIRLMQEAHESRKVMEETIQSVEKMRNKCAKKFRRRAKHMLAVGYNPGTAQAYLNNSIAEMDSHINERFAPYGYELR